MADLNIVSVCGSLRKASFNAALQRTLPSLAPAGLKITPAPAWADIPVYNFDLQGAGFPGAGDGLGGRYSQCRRRDHRLARIQLDHPRRA